MSECIDPLYYGECAYNDGVLCSASKEDKEACKEGHEKYMAMLKSCRRVK